MSREQEVRTSDLEKLRSELTRSILEEVQVLVDNSWGAQIIGKIVDRGVEKVGHQQRITAEAVAAAEEAEKRARLAEERRVAIEAQIKDLVVERRDLQSALDGLRAEYNTLLPKIEELRRERQEHVARVKRALEQEAS